MNNLFLILLPLVTWTAIVVCNDGSESFSESGEGASEAATATQNTTAPITTEAAPQDAQVASKLAKLQEKVDAQEHEIERLRLQNNVKEEKSSKRDFSLDDLKLKLEVNLFSYY